MDYANSSSYSSWAWIDSHSDKQVIEKLQKDPAFLQQLTKETPNAKLIGRLVLILTNIPANGDKKIQAQFDQQVEKLFGFFKGLSRNVPSKTAVSAVNKITHKAESKSFRLFKGIFSEAKLKRGLQKAIQNDQPQLVYEMLNQLEQIDASLKGPHNEPLLEWALVHEHSEIAALILDRGNLSTEEIFSTLHLAAHMDKTEVLSNEKLLNQLSKNHSREHLVILALTVKDKGLQEKLLGKVVGWQYSIVSSNLITEMLRLQNPAIAIKFIQGLKLIPEPVRSAFIKNNLQQLATIAVQHVLSFQALKELASPKEFRNVISNSVNGILFYIRDTETLDEIAAILPKEEFFALLSARMPDYLQTDIMDNFGVNININDLDDIEPKQPFFGLLSSIMPNNLKTATMSNFGIFWTNPFIMLFLSQQIDPKNPKLVSFADYFMQRLSSKEFCDLIDKMSVNPFFSNLEIREFSEVYLLQNIKLLKKYYTNDEVVTILSRKFLQSLDLKNSKKFIQMIARGLGVQDVENWFSKIAGQLFKENVSLSIDFEETKSFFDFMLQTLGEEKFVNLLKPFFSISSFNPACEQAIKDCCSHIPPMILKKLFTENSSKLLDFYIKEQDFSFFDFLDQLPYEERVAFINENNIFHLIVSHEKPSFMALSESPNPFYTYFSNLVKHPDPHIEQTSWRTILSKEVDGQNNTGAAAIDRLISQYNVFMLAKLNEHYPLILKEYISIDNPQILPLLHSSEVYRLVEQFDPRFTMLEVFYANGKLRNSFLYDSKEKIAFGSSFPRIAQWIKQNIQSEEELGKAVIKKIQENPSAFVKHVGNEVLAAAFMLGDNQTLFTITQLLGQQQTAQQLQVLCEQFPVMAPFFKEALDFIAYQLDERHMDAEKVKLVSGVEKEKLEPFDYKQILEKFSAINFSHPEQLGYRDPHKIKNDVGTNSYALVSVATLKIGLDKLINLYVPKNTPFVGTPPAFIGKPPKLNPELPQFYDNLKHYYQEILYHIAELEKQPPEDAMELRDQLDKISRNLIDLAISSLHCGSRWVSEALESISDLRGIPPSLELMLNWIFAGMRTMVAEQIAGYHGADSHTTNTIMGFLGNRMGLPKAESIIEHLKDSDLEEEDIINRFYNQYSPSNMLAYLVEHLEDKPRLREVVLDWFRDNPGEFKNEHYAQLKEELKGDENVTKLLNPVASDTINSKELSEFVEVIKDHQFSSNLPQRLNELEQLLNEKKRDIYVLELAGILRQEFRGNLSLTAIQRITTFLSVEKSLQTAFHTYLLSSGQEADIKELTDVVQKLDQANKLVAYLKENGVALDNETAMRAIGHEEPFVLIDGAIDRLKGNEFVSTIYTSLGTQLLEVIPDLVIESEELGAKLEKAVTLEQKIDLISEVWQQVFKEQHAKELKSLLAVARHEPAVLESIMQVLQLPTQENIETCKTILLREPVLQYRFNKEQLMRLLVENEFLQSRIISPL